MSPNKRFSGRRCAPPLNRQLAIMVAQSQNLKWRAVDSGAAHALTTVTNSPGVVYPLAANDLPGALQRIPGVGSYYVSGYTTGDTLPAGFSAGGEMLVTRTDGGLLKNYQWAFAVSSDGSVSMMGPFKDFAGHHVYSGQAVPVDSLFNHTPFSTQSKGQRDG